MKKTSNLFEKLAMYEVVNQNQINGGWYQTSGGSLDNQMDGSESKENIAKTGFNGDTWATTRIGDTREQSGNYADSH